MLHRLMQKLKERTKGLVLLTGTSTPVHPAEVWDPLCLLGLPEEWIVRESVAPWHSIHLGQITQVNSTSIGSARLTEVHAGSRLVPALGMVSMPSG